MGTKIVTRVNVMNSKYFGIGVIALIILTGMGTVNCIGKRVSDPGCQLPQEFILKDDLPGFDAEIFRIRRNRLVGKIKGDIAIISASTGNDFIYLTGLTGDSRAVAVIDNSSDKPFRLFLLPREPMATLWDGERPGVEGATEKYGADAAWPIGELDVMLPEIIAGKKSLSLHIDDKAIHEKIAGLSGTDHLIVNEDLSPLIHEMRVIKDDLEIKLMERAVEVTALAQKRAMQTTRPGQREYDAQAEIEYVFRKNGLGTGFSTITGSGPNAAILHYVHNDRTMLEGDLLLMDIGAKYRGYVADITRTIPVNGKFSEKQRELYSLVLKANQEAIKVMVPGKRILDCHHRATEIIVRGLYDIGLITDTTSWWQKRFYIQYRNNHYIGLHVHDVGRYGDLDAPDRDSYILNPEIRGRELLPGMVMTIEPGIYLIADRLEHLHGLFGKMASAEELDAFADKVRPVYEKYAGIGIRIEDDVLITNEGNRVLSKNAPKTIEDIEAEMSRK